MIGLILDAKVVVEHPTRLHQVPGDVFLPHVDIESLGRVACPVAIGTDVKSCHQIDMSVSELIEHCRHKVEEIEVICCILLLHQVHSLTVDGVDRVPVHSFLIQEAVSLIDDRPERLEIGSVVSIPRL